VTGDKPRLIEAFAGRRFQAPKQRVARCRAVWFEAHHYRVGQRGVAKRGIHDL
jgi:hypothetical protein